MKMNKKGFTLIELLAVIVVLAIIALIATPIVMNTINKAQENANARSLENYAAQLELGFAQAMLDTTNDTATKLQAAAKTYADENVKGEKPAVDGLTITWATGDTGVVEKIAAQYKSKDYCYTNAAGAKVGACS